MDSSRPDSGIVRIAVVGPLSGPGAAWGQLLVAAAAAVRHPSVRWELFDDRGETGEAVARAAEVVADGGFAAVLTHFHHTGAGAVLPVYRAAGLLVVLPLATTPGAFRIGTGTGIDRTVLRLSPDDRGQVAAVIRACRENGRRLLAVLHDGSDRGRQLAGRLTGAGSPELDVRAHRNWPDSDWAGAVAVCGTRAGVTELLHHGLKKEPGHLIVLTDDCDIPEATGTVERPAASRVLVTRVVGGSATRVAAAFAAVAGALAKHPERRGGDLRETVRGELPDVFSPEGDLLGTSPGSGWEVRPQRTLTPPRGPSGACHHEIAVLGGGMVGRAAAAELAEGGATVVLLDDGTPGSSASAVSGGLVRAFELDEAERDLACEAFLTLWGLPELATAYGYHRTGALVLLGPQDLDKATAGVAALGKAGVAAELLTVPELAARWPDIRTTGLAGAVWEPGAGYVRPAVALAALLDRAQRAGAQLLPHHRVDTLAADADGVALLTTAGPMDDDTTSGPAQDDTTAGQPEDDRPSAEVRAEVVLVAAGCSAPALLGDRWPAGHPARTKRIRYAIFDRGGRELPTIVDATTGSWARPDGLDGMLAGYPAEEWNQPAAPATMPDDQQVQWIRDGLSPRLPFLAGARLLTGSSGTDLFAADGPVLGPLPGLPRTVVAAGWSGGGFKTAPAAARRAAKAALHLLGDQRARTAGPLPDVRVTPQD